ncbi:MAG: hypothetical protein JWP52_2945 [Rhizobacter sp.]|nr:hypothetical protein [Rhizobacter sp.]
MSRLPWFKRALRAMALAITLMACGVSACMADDQSQDLEYQVKAAFLFKFLNFIQWPPRGFERPDSPLVIGVIGADLMAADLAALVADRNANGHPITTRKVQAGESLQGLHMLFVGRAHSSRVPALLDAVKGGALLIVTESDEAFALGSAINFVVVDNKVRFDVSLRAAEKYDLKISSRLLAVARLVVPSPS